MWELLADDGDRRAKAIENGHRERCSDCQPVYEVVQRVAQRDHPCHRPDAGQLSSSEPSARPLQQHRLSTQDISIHIQTNSTSNMMLLNPQRWVPHVIYLFMSGFYCFRAEMRHRLDGARDLGQRSEDNLVSAGSCDG